MPGVTVPRHPITSSASLWRFRWLLIANPRFGLRCVRLAGVVLRTYILPQFTAHRRTRLALDMELDEAIPFNPGWLDCYLGFVRLWQGSLGWLHLRFGSRAMPEMEAFIDGLAGLFREAGKVFSLCDTTLASRPGPRLSPGSLLIHCFDRNSFCFPSLHVMIVRYNHLRLAEAVGRLCGGSGACAAEIAFLEERSFRIVESIAHVKQHSLSDIPAALFLMHALGSREGMPGPDREADLRFLQGLFREEEHGPLGARIRAFLRGLYARLHAAREEGAGAHETLAGFLGRYRDEVEALLRELPGGRAPGPA